MKSIEITLSTGDIPLEDVTDAVAGKLWDDVIKAKNAKTMPSVTTDEDVTALLNPDHIVGLTVSEA